MFAYYKERIDRILNYSVYLKRDTSKIKKETLSFLMLNWPISCFLESNLKSPNVRFPLQFRM